MEGPPLYITIGLVLLVLAMAFLLVIIYAYRQLVRDLRRNARVRTRLAVSFRETRVMLRQLEVALKQRPENTEQLLEIKKKMVAVSGDRETMLAKCRETDELLMAVAENCLYMFALFVSRRWNFLPLAPDAALAPDTAEKGHHMKERQD